MVRVMAAVSLSAMAVALVWLSAWRFLLDRERWRADRWARIRALEDLELDGVVEPPPT